MIKHNVKSIDLTSNFADLLCLWQTCFPEDADFGETFLRSAAPNAKILGVCENGRVVSCAYFIPAAFHKGNEIFSAYYVYGVGTLPSHRGKGVASSVLEYAKNTLSCDLLFLYPAKPSLRTYYENIGYLSVLYRNERTAPQETLQKIPFTETPFVASVYAEKRSDFLRFHNVSYTQMDLMVLQTLLSHAKILNFDNGIALCVVDDHTIFLPELLCERNDISVILSTVKQQYPDKQVIAYTIGEEQVSGMVCPCSDKPKKQFTKNEKVVFFGTFFAE